MTFMHITQAHCPTTSVSKRTLRSRCKEIQTARNVIGGGEPYTLLQYELHSLSVEERQQLLKDAGITPEVGPAEMLAIKSCLAIPWHKLRLLRR